MHVQKTLLMLKYVNCLKSVDSFPVTSLDLLRNQKMSQLSNLKCGFKFFSIFEEHTFVDFFISLGML